MGGGFIGETEEGIVLVGWRPNRSGEEFEWGYICTVRQRQEEESKGDDYEVEEEEDEGKKRTSSLPYCCCS